MKHLLVYPMAFYVFYIWCIAIYNLRTRVRSMKSGSVDPKYFKAYVANSLPENVIVAGRHFDNQFQVPILFLITCCAHILVGQFNNFTVGLAWLFILTRIGHSIVHLGKNKLRPRVAFYASGWLVLLALWAQLLYLMERIQV